MIWVWPCYWKPHPKRVLFLGEGQLQHQLASSCFGHLGRNLWNLDSLHFRNEDFGKIFSVMQKKKSYLRYAKFDVMSNITTR